MQQVITVLRQRGIIARSFSKKWSLTLCQSNPTRKAPILQTEYYSGHSGLLLARYPDRQLLSILGGARFFARRWKKPRDNPSPECNLVPQPATVSEVPKVWSHVPVIATKDVVFPLFTNYIKISNPVLIALIRRKIKLNEPYVGVFLKKDEENKADVVENLDDIYSIGTFSQVTAIQDMGDQLRLEMDTHRRIKIVNQIVENHQPEQDEKSKNKRSLCKTPENTERSEGVEKADKEANLTEVNSTLPDVYEETFKLLNASLFQPKRHPVLMVEVVNVNDEYEQTEELKVLTQEINGVILDLCNLDRTFRLLRRLWQKHSVVGNPAYLSDLGARLGAHSSLDQEKLQGVLEERDILKRLRLSLALLKKHLMKERHEIDTIKIKEKVTLQDQIHFLHQQVKAIKNDLILIKYNTYLS